jgi:hypothetical protein
MTQGLVLDNLKKFLKHTNPSTSPELEKLLDEGHCFGFSFCFGAMKKIGKLKWWEAALAAVANWNGDPDTLDKIIVLPNTEANSSLRNIFERVFNYIIFHQQGELLSTLIFEHPVSYAVSQHNMLTPDKSNFEIINADGDIEKIKRREHIAGYFLREDLDFLLNEVHIKGAVCLLENRGHVISIDYDYKEGKWILYDPNFLHLNTDKMHSTFNSKEELIDKILLILENALCIEMIYIEKTLPPDKKEQSATNYFDLFLNNLTPNKTLSLLKERGISVIAAYTPENLDRMLKLASTSKQSSKLLIEALAATTKTGWTGLQSVARYAPQDLPQLLEIVKPFPQSPNLLAQALAATNDNGWAGLQTVARHAPQYLPQLLEIVKPFPQSPKLLAQTLAATTKDGWTSLQMVARYAPQALPQLLEIVKPFPQSPKLLARALAATNQDGCTGLQAVEQYSPQALSQLLEIVKPFPQNPEQLAQALATTRKDGWAGFHTVAQDSPQALFELLEYFPKNYNFKENFPEKTIQHFLNQINNTEEVRRLIDKIEMNRNKFSHLFERKGLLTTRSLRGHSWKGKEVSGTWVKIINTAKQRIVDLQDKKNKHINDDDLKFLEIKTQRAGFFSDNKYSEEYRAKKKSAHGKQKKKVGPI